MLHDPKQPLPFQPREDGPSYLLRVPRVADRSAYRHALSMAGARRWGQLDLVATARAAVESLLADPADEAERLARLAELDAHAEAIQAALTIWTEDRSKENLAALTEAMVPRGNVAATIEILLSIDEATGQPVAPVLAERVADNVVHAELLGLVAARMFLVGWDGIEDEDGAPLPFRRTKFGFSDDLLGRVPTGDIVAIGGKINELIEPRAARLGNSASASGGRSSPKSSSTPSTPQQSDPSTATGGTAPGSDATETG